MLFLRRRLNYYCWKYRPTQHNMSVEAFLTRELSIRFIDARELANEARVNLGLQGYPNKEQQRKIKSQAIKLFSSLSEEEKLAMHQMNETLDSIKSVNSGYLTDATSQMDYDYSDNESQSLHSRTSTKIGRGVRRWFLGSQ